MKQIRSYTSIWNVEKVIYAINDLKLPFPVTFHQMTWFVLSLLFVMLFSDLPPLSFIEGSFLKYLGIPIFFAWFMSQKTFDGKKPLGFVRSILHYLLSPKMTYAGKAVKLHKEHNTNKITIVRSELFELSD